MEFPDRDGSRHRIKFVPDIQGTREGNILQARLVINGMKRLVPGDVLMKAGAEALKALRQQIRTDPHAPKPGGVMTRPFSSVNERITGFAVFSELEDMEGKVPSS